MRGQGRYLDVEENHIVYFKSHLPLSPFPARRVAHLIGVEQTSALSLIGSARPHNQNSRIKMKSTQFCSKICQRSKNQTVTMSDILGFTQTDFCNGYD